MCSMYKAGGRFSQPSSSCMIHPAPYIQRKAWSWGHPPSLVQATKKGSTANFGTNSLRMQRDSFGSTRNSSCCCTLQLIYIIPPLSRRRRGLQRRPAPRLPSAAALPARAPSQRWAPAAVLRCCRRRPPGPAAAASPARPMHPPCWRARQSEALPCRCCCCCGLRRRTPPAPRTIPAAPWATYKAPPE